MRPHEEYENSPYGQHINKTKISTKVHFRTQTSQHHTKLAPCCSSYEQPGGMTKRPERASEKAHQSAQTAEQ